MTKRPFLIAALMMVLVLIVTGAAVASYIGTITIDWSVLSGGGAPSTAGDVTINGSLGQTAVGSSSSGSGTTELGSGFWYGTTTDSTRLLFLPLVLHGT